MDRQVGPDELQRPQDQGASDTIDEIFQLAMRAIQAIINMQWDTAQRLNELAEAKANAFDGQEGDLVRGVLGVLTTMNEGMALQIRDTDPERFHRSFQHLDEARNRLQELRSLFPDKTANAGFKFAIANLELMVIWAARGRARELGDQRQVLICDAQIKALIDAMPEEDKSQLQYMVALIRYMGMMGRTKEIMVALNTMDLVRALQIIAEFRKEGGAALAVIRQNLGSGVILQKSEQGMSGLYQYIEALEGYVGVLHDSIVGDVTRVHVNKLARSEELFRSGAKKLVEMIIILRSISEQDEKDMVTSLEAPIVLVRNLRVLCQESLKPKSWVAWASLKFIVVFLVTAVVLVAVVASTNGGSGFSGGILTGYIVLVSFVAGLIGGFGFDALRLLPFATLLSKSLQATQKPSDESAGP